MPSKGACSKPTEEKKSPVTRFPAARAPRRTAPDAPVETRGFLPRVTRTSRDARRLFPGISRDERRGYRVASQGGTLTSSSSRVFSPRVTLLCFLARGPSPSASALTDVAPPRARRSIHRGASLRVGARPRASRHSLPPRQQVSARPRPPRVISTVGGL